MIDDNDLREILHRRADAVPATPTDVGAAVRRGRRRQFLTGSVSLLVVVVVTVGMLSGIDALRSTQPDPPIGPSPSIEPSPGLQVENERIGFVGLAPADAEPSLPEVGELVISFSYFCCPGHSMNVYSDGRMIWTQYNVTEPGEVGWFDLAPQGASQYETGYLEQRLTPEGVEMLRSELISSGLFEENHSFVKKQIELTIRVRRGDEMVRLNASTADDPFKATDEQARGIERITELFKDPDAFLPDDAWADRTIRAFIPSRYFVVIHFYSSGGRTPDDPSELPPPADDLLRAADVVGRSSTCQIVTPDEARRIRAELRGAFGDLTIPTEGNGFLGAAPVTIKSALPNQQHCS